MAEKILNTRLLMKVDTLENWNNSTLPLKKGELAFATVASSAGTGLSEPVVMVKIGEDGVKTFKDLSFNFYAKASDVLSACKSEASLKAFVNSVITDAGVATDEALKALSTQVTTNKDDITALKTAVGDTESGLVKSVADNAAAIGALQGLVGDQDVATRIANAITALNLANTYDAKGAAAAAETAAKSHADGLNTAMNTRVEALEAIDHDHDNKGVLDGITAEKVAAWDSAEESAKSHADDLDDAMDERVKALEAKFGDGEGNVESQIDSAVAEEAALREAADTALGNRVKAIEDDYLKAADKTALQEQITANDGEIAALQTLVGDENVATKIANAVKVETERAQAAEKVNSDAIAVLNGNSSVEGSVDKKVADAINTFATQVSDDATVNTYKELIEYAATHGSEFTELVGEVDANAKAIETLNGAATVAGSVDKKIADAIAAENLGQYATDTELAGVDGRLATVEGDYLKSADKTELQNAINTKAAQADLDTAEAAIDALEDLVGDTKVATQIADGIAKALKVDGVDKYALASALTEAVARIGQNEIDIAALEGRMDDAEGDIDNLQAEIVKKANDAELAAIAKTGNVNDLIQTDGDVLIFDCGTSV